MQLKAQQRDKNLQRKIADVPHTDLVVLLNSFLIRIFLESYDIVMWRMK